ncbi:MAG TPA: hypothetical protein VIR58_19650, partial [Acidimicrobiales bacterium]
MSSMKPGSTPAPLDTEDPSPMVGGWPERLRTLLRAAVELSAPHERDDVLQEIVDSAAVVADARYVALGIY